MKKLIIVLGIILTSGIAAFAISNSKETATTNTQIKSDRVILEKNQSRAGNFQSDIATAD